MSPDKKMRPAFMETADEESGQILEGTTVEASITSSPIKEKANSKKSRSQSTSPVTNGQTDSDSTVLSPRHSRRDKDSKSRGKEKESERDRPKDKGKDKASGKKVTMRPAIKESKTTPTVLHHGKPQEQEYYGVSSHTPAPRPRSHSTRTPAHLNPKTYHPPQANAAFYHTQPQLLTPTSYPPNYSYGSHSLQPSPVLPPSPMDYFQAQTERLGQRLQGVPRPSSAMAFRSASSTYPYDYDQENDPPMQRRPSLRKRDTRGLEEDRMRMPPPPPPRPQSARPSHHVLRPPPPQVHRTRGYYEDEDLLTSDAGLYREVPHFPPVEYSIPTQRTRRGSITYDRPSLRIQPASTSSRRPHSYYGGDYKDKLQMASVYQDLTSGGPTALTKEALHKANRRSQGGSSRSTRSSGSREESDWRHSATTRTTRSSAGPDEDVTIRVKGTAVVKVSGTEIQCQDGAELNISSGRISTSRTGGSDKTSTVYTDERKSRGDRPQQRARASSQSNSFTRTSQPYLPYPTAFVDPFYRRY